MVIRNIAILLFLILVSGCVKYELHAFRIDEFEVGLDVDDVELSFSILDLKRNDGSNFFFYQVSRTTKPYRLVVKADIINLDYYLLYVDSVHVQFAGGDVETYGSSEIVFKKEKLKSHYTKTPNGSFKVNKDGIIFANIYNENVINKYEDCVVTVKGYIQSDEIKNQFSIKAKAEYGFNERWEFGPRN